MYWLRIYDNNFPDQERFIEINPKANTWRYEVPAIDGREPIVYEGAPDLKNYLYFSPVEDRTGVLKAPFAADSGVRTISYSHIQLVAKVGDRETGLRDGEVIEADGDRVVPGFSQCPRCGESVPITNQTLIDQGLQREQVISIEAEGSVSTDQGDHDMWGDRRSKNIGGSPGDGDIDWITATGPNFNSTVYPQGDTSDDEVSFEEDGSASYTSNSGNGIRVDTTQDKGDGTYETVRVSIEGSGDEDTPVTVRVTTGDDGQTTVEVEGLPPGKEVNITIGRVDANNPDDRNSDTVTVTTNGDTVKAKLDPGEDKLAVQNADNVQGGSCDNGQFDADFETDVDCGGECNPCDDGLTCAADDDCRGGTCADNVCESAQCHDDTKNGDETGVDCGGSTCGACGPGSICTVDSDCSTDNCECGASSGNCASNSGTCGAAKLVVDQPTTDGVAVSGSFTVPAQCSQVYVEAWGAAGGAGGGASGPGPGPGGTPGGAGGYVSGTLTVSAGDVIDVWVGQGGDFGVVYDFGGTPGIGSKYGVATSGGEGDGDSFTGGGGDGGGLTSVQVSGSTSASFVIPAGGGGTDIGTGDDVAAGFGGGATDSNGEAAPIASGEAGGGAGDVGGSYLGSNGGAAAGTYGTYPAGFSTADGLDGVPANTSAPDYSLCQGIGQGSVGAGSNEVGSGFNAGGDGCVILRCVAP